MRLIIIQTTPPHTNDLLTGKVERLVGVDVEHSFNGEGGREGPAATRGGGVNEGLLSEGKTKEKER